MYEVDKMKSLTNPVLRDMIFLETPISQNKDCVSGAGFCFAQSNTDIVIEGPHQGAVVCEIGVFQMTCSSGAGFWFLASRGTLKASGPEQRTTADPGPDPITGKAMKGLAALYHEPPAIPKISRPGSDLAREDFAMFMNAPRANGTVEVELTRRDCEALATACFEAQAAMERRGNEDAALLEKLQLLGNVFNALFYAVPERGGA